MRIVAEGEITLADLRSRLAMHPATLGQIVDRIARLQFLVIEPLVSDRRVRTLTLTDQGRQLLESAPLAGPVRLRSAEDVATSQLLTDAFSAAIAAFGVERWAES